MPNYYSEKKYEGPEAIVVAMDIGATQSAVSFAYFSPGNHTQGKMVASWPGASWIGAIKTPSIVSYRGSVVKACGAEALQDFEEHPENVAYRFKLHLHPSLISQSNSSESEIPPLPVGITIEWVYADMMHYLMENTQRSFKNTNPNGAEIWARLRDTIVIVLAMPNGWDIRERSTLRKAAIRASLVTEESAGQLLQFMTESEASVHYALAQDYGRWLKERTVFAVIDCGGYTVETTVYRCVSTHPLSLYETCPSTYLQTGGIFVNREVEKMLKKKLKGTPFGDPETIKRMVDAFEKKASFNREQSASEQSSECARQLKPTFDDFLDQHKLRFGGILDNDARLGIEKGRITLSNEDLRPAFDTVTTKICNGCSEVLLSQKAEYVLLVGGFGDSPYMQKVLSKRIGCHGIQMITVEAYGRTAVVGGVIIGHIKQFSVARTVRATFGGCVRQHYEKRLHRERKHTIQISSDGKKRVDGAFHVWIKKGAIPPGNFAHRLPYHVTWDATSTSQSELRLELRAIEIEVFAWEDDNIPIWCKDEQGAVLKGMRLICTLNADLSSLAGGLPITTGSRGRRFYRVDYAVCFYFVGTQLRANLQWKEMGVFREGPVTVMPYVSGGASSIFSSSHPPQTIKNYPHPSLGYTSLLATPQSMGRESQAKVMPIAEEKSDERMIFESLSIAEEDDPPKAAMARGDPPASQISSSLSELPENAAFYFPDATMLSSRAATLQRPSREAPISIPPSTIQSHTDLISTLKDTAMSDTRASDSLPDFLHEQNQTLRQKSTSGAHSSVGSTSQYYSFDSSSVSQYRSLNSSSVTVSQYYSLNSSSVTVSSDRKTEETVELRDPNNGAEGDGVSATLEKLMIDYVPCDLSGQVVVPDRGNPAPGGLADVHFGRFGNKEVAVKVLRIRKGRRVDPYWEASNQRRIRREMHVWSALKHRNICEFLGYSMDFGDHPALISMWCHHGTASDYLESKELSVRERIRLALDVSEGLCYLHDLKIVHGDLKPNNVLVDDTGVARLCDFGLVRLVDWEGPAGMTTTSPYTGTERYKAPELFESLDNGHPVATFEGDMYSLGCIMLELIEGLYPFERFWKAGLRKAIMEGHSPALRSATTRALSDMTDFFWNLLEACWGDPSSRPGIKEVVDVLQGFLRAMPPTS